MKKSKRKRYEETVVQNFRQMQKAERKEQETIQHWDTFGFLIPHIAMGYVIGTVVGYGIVAYLAIRWVIYPLYSFFFGR